MEDWKSKYDEIDNAPEVYITERTRWCHIHKSYMEHERREWAPRNMEGLWFDAVRWRLYQQTRLNTTPLLSRMDEIRSKPFYINDTETGKFRYCIPFEK